MNFLDRIKKLINRILNTLQKSNSINGIEDASTTSEISIIDTSTLNINRVLTVEEKQRLETYSKEIDISSNQIMEYGNEISRNVSFYMEMSRKRLNQSIDKNREFIEKPTTENIIRQKLDIEINKSEINSILTELQKLRRECELRIIALENRGNIEIKKGKRKLPFLSDKTDLVKIYQINNAIERIKTTIKIIDLLTHSIRNEMISTFQEEKTLDKFIENNDNEQNIEIVNKVLTEKFEELKEILKALQEIENNSDEIIGELLNADISSKTIQEKIAMITTAKRYIDLYVEKNKREFLKPEGLLEKIKQKTEELWNKIETDYYDRELWAKKKFTTKEGSYYNEAKQIEKILLIFDELIPEEFKREFYRIMFYSNALMCEYYENDVNKQFTIGNNTERKYYAEFLSEIIEKVHKDSKDAELLRFMDTNLPIRDIEQILNDYEKVIALLRIEKQGREGLFTLKLFRDRILNGRTGTIKRNENLELVLTFDELDECLSLETLKEIYKVFKVTFNYRKAAFSVDGDAEKNINGASSKFALEILKLFLRTPKKENTIFDFLDLSTGISPTSIEIPRCVEEVHTTSYNEDQSADRIVYANLFFLSMRGAKSNLKTVPYNIGTSFHANLEQAINKKVRLNKERKDQNKEGWNQKYINVTYRNALGRSQTVKMSLAEIIGRYATAIEKISQGEIKKEYIANRILEFDSLSIRPYNDDWMYIDENNNIHVSLVLDGMQTQMADADMGMFFITKTLTRGLLYCKGNKQLKTRELYKHPRNSEADSMAEYIAYMITNKRYMGSKLQTARSSYSSLPYLSSVSDNIRDYYKIFIEEKKLDDLEQGKMIGRILKDPSKMLTIIDEAITQKTESPKGDSQEGMDL